MQLPEGRGVRESMSVSVRVPCGTERWPLPQRWSESVFGSRRKQDGSGFYPFPRDAQDHFVLGRNDRMFYLFQTSRRHDLIWRLGVKMLSVFVLGLQISSGSSVAVCGLVYTGWQQVRNINETVGCLNPIRLAVPLTDVIVVTGSFAH